MVERTPFVFESKDRQPVERTMIKLNELSKEKTYCIDFANGLWYVYEVEDEDDI